VQIAGPCGFLIVINALCRAEQVQFAINPSEDDMSDKMSGNNGDVSRRDVFRKSAMMVGGVALLSTGLASVTARAQAAKKTQAEAGYQNKPNGDANCANCALFLAPSSCGVVDGTISPQGWCKLYVKKS
jgi:hypothetical protein